VKTVIKLRPSRTKNQRRRQEELRFVFRMRNNSQSFLNWIAHLQPGASYPSSAVDLYEIYLNGFTPDRMIEGEFPLASIEIVESADD